MRLQNLLELALNSPDLRLAQQGLPGVLAAVMSEKSVNVQRSQAVNFTFVLQRKRG